MMNKMAVQATLVSNALDKEQETEENDNIDVSEDNAVQDFCQQIIKSEPISDDEQDGGSRDAIEDNNAMDKKQKTVVDDNFDVKKESFTSEESASPGFCQVFIKNEYVSDDEQNGDSGDATEDNNALDKDETNSNTVTDNLIKCESVWDDEQDGGSSDASKHNMDKYKTKSNTDTDSQEFQCSMCKEVFTDRLTYDTHLRNHINNVMGLDCLFCNKKLCKNSNLKKHMKYHLGIKDYECTTCNKKFVVSSSLKRHMKIHEGIKEYECLICEKKFTQKDDLTRHLKIHGGKDYKCSICQKKFTQNSFLKIHMKIHEGIKDYGNIMKTYERKN